MCVAELWCWWTIKGFTDSSEVLKGSIRNKPKQRAWLMGVNPVEGLYRRNVSAGGCKAIYRDINYFTGMTGVTARQQPEYLKLPVINSIGQRGKGDWFTSPFHISTCLYPLIWKSCRQWWWSTYPPKTPFKAVRSAHTATFQPRLSGSEGTLILGEKKKKKKMINTTKLGRAAVPKRTG